jgi:hypothetical protein
MTLALFCAEPLKTRQISYSKSDPGQEDLAFLAAVPRPSTLLALKQVVDTALEAKRMHKLRDSAAVAHARRAYKKAPLPKLRGFVHPIKQLALGQQNG